MGFPPTFSDEDLVARQVFSVSTQITIQGIHVGLFSDIYANNFTRVHNKLYATTWSGIVREHWHSVKDQFFEQRDGDPGEHCLSC